ncbi:MAG: PAS domain S-box protein, partial [Methanomassiliicoccales archaeon]|nr:PAS domain S-box protein [Methanomassiliicoccales archaeon]
DILTFVSNEVAMAIERKNSEKALKGSEKKYRNFVERANDGITIIQDGVTRYTNPKLAEMGGYTIEETVGRPFTDFVWPEDVPKLADYYKRRLRGEEVPSIYEARLKGKRGECLHVELNTAVIEYEGRPAEFAIVRDLSYKIEAQEALRRSEQKYRTIFETTGTAMVMIEEDGTISLANEEILNLTGYSKEEIEGRMKIEDLVADEEIKRIMEYHELRRKDAGLAPHGYETSIKDKKGEVRKVWVTIDLIPETKQSVASLIDITEVKKLERRLSEKSQEQTLLLDNIETMVWYATDPETYGAVNRARADFLGKKKEDLEGKKIWEILPTQEAKVGVIGNRIAFEEKRTYRGDEWVTTARGEKRCVAVTKIPKLDANGNVQFVVCTGHDITDSRRVEEALRQSENRFDQLAEQSHTVTWEIDADGLYTYVSRVSETVWGYHPDELVGKKHFYDLTPEDERESLKAMAFATFERKERFDNLENAVQAKDGRIVWVSTNGIPLLNADGTLRGYQGNDTDITERKIFERELNKKSDEQTQLLNNIETMVYFATDPETHGKMNQARADFLGMRVEELEGMSLRKLMSKESAEVAIAGNRYVFETKKPYHGQEWITNLKGERRLFSVMKVPMLDEKGNVKFVVASAHDVTDLEEARNALSLANKKLNLLGNVTRHDILNQLTVISGGLDMAKGIVKEDRARKFIDMALNASGSIEKYLEFSRDYERMGTTKPEWIEAKEACMKGMSTLETGDVSLVVDLEGLEIYADKLLEKVFHNLIGNALKHGEKVSTVHIHSKGEDGHMVLLCEDDGKGIPKDKKESLIEGRYGRGLYLVKEILGITGMTITEIGEEGRGARFEISIPEGNYRLKDR